MDRGGATGGGLPPAFPDRVGAVKRKREIRREASSGQNHNYNQNIVVIIHTYMLTISM
jgi:hypothetical protein